MAAGAVPAGVLRIHKMRGVGEVSALLPQPSGLEGFLPISEGLFSHHPPVLDREEEGELVSIHGNLARRPHSVDLGYRDHLVSGVDQLDGVNRVPGQSLLVLLVDQTYGLLAVAGPQEERFEHHVRVIDLGQSIEVATVVRGESRSDQLHVLLRHRPPSISRRTGC